MNKRQVKILAMVYANAGEGASLDRICKQLGISRTVASMEIGQLVELNAVKEYPGELFKPSSGKLKMMS